MRVLPLLLLVACGYGELERADYPDDAAKLLCKRYDKCVFGYYEAEFDADKEACRTKTADLIDQVSVLAEQAGCSYNGETAGECLTELAKLDCAEFYDELFGDPDAEMCGEVFSCPGS